MTTINMEVWASLIFSFGNTGTTKDLIILRIWAQQKKCHLEFLTGCLYYTTEVVELFSMYHMQNTVHVCGKAMEIHNQSLYQI